jgi:hypothetical protein
MPASSRVLSLDQVRAVWLVHPCLVVEYWQHFILESQCRPSRANRCATCCLHIARACPRLSFIMLKSWVGLTAYTYYAARPRAQFLSLYLISFSAERRLLSRISCVRRLPLPFRW